MPVRSENLRDLVADVAAAYFSNSHVPIADIPDVMGKIASSLLAVPDGEAREDTASAAPEETSRPTTAQVKASVRADSLISFEDGRPYRTLTRHLSARGLTPAAYRQKWGLPPDYPMVASDYSAARAETARRLGLGSRGLAARAARSRLHADQAQAREPDEAAPTPARGDRDQEPEGAAKRGAARRSRRSAPQAGGG